MSIALLLYPWPLTLGVSLRPKEKGFLPFNLSLRVKEIYPRLIKSIFHLLALLSPCYRTYPVTPFSTTFHLFCRERLGAKKEECVCEVERERI